MYHRMIGIQANEVALQITGLMRGEASGNNVSLQTRLTDDLPRVWGDRVQLQQVVLNLILNAVEAMKMVALGSRRLSISSTKNDEGVVISVQDTGVGFVSENLDRIFNAFYTTKCGGMGMGLAISRSIVEAHGGRIWATQNFPCGADLQFVLPTRVETNS